MKYLKVYNIFESDYFKNRNLSYPTLEWNIIYSIDKWDDRLDNVRDSVVNYWEDTKESLDISDEDEKIIPLSEIVYTTQKGVDKNIIDNMSEQEFMEGDIIMVRDLNGLLWVLDGHHRLCIDRSNFRDSMVYLIDRDQINFINHIIYAEGEEDGFDY